VRHAGQAVESDVVGARVADQRFHDAAAQRGGLVETAGKGIDRCERGCVRAQHLVIALAALVDLAQAVA